MYNAYQNQSEIEHIAAALDVQVETFQADRRLGEIRMKRTIRYALTSYIIIFVLVLFIRTLKGQGQYNDILSRSVPEILGIVGATFFQDRKSTRLNSSHVSISYAVFCLKKKNNNINTEHTTDSRD